MCVAVPCQEAIELADITALGTGIRFRFSVWVGNLVLYRVGVWLSRATRIPTTHIESNCQNLIFGRSSCEILNKFRLFIGLSSMKSCGFSEEEEAAAGGGRKRLISAQDLKTRYPKASQGVGLGILAALPSSESKPPTLNLSSPSKNLLYRISPAHKIKISWASDKQNPPMPFIPGSSAAPKPQSNKCGRRQASADAQKPRRCRPAVAVHSQPRSDVSAFPPADFLYACYLCRRRLSHSKDIYMYRGDMAFCSEECRYKQIASDERKERRASAAPISSSCCSPMFTTSKFAIC